MGDKILEIYIFKIVLFFSLPCGVKKEVFVPKVQILPLKRGIRTVTEAKQQQKQQRDPQSFEQHHDNDTQGLYMGHT